MSTTTTTTTTATATSTRKARAPPRIGFASVNPNNIGTLRKLNLVLFPIKYTEQFYKDVLLPEHEDYCKLVYYNDIPVGTICARLEKGKTDQEAKLYIMTMGVLAPYRSLGLGTQALQAVVTSALGTQSASSSPPSTSTSPAASSPKPKSIASIYLHVQTSNAEARRFYERNGFAEVGKIDGYYKKIEPKDAWVLEKNLVKASP